MEAICKADFDAREAAQKAAEKMLEEAKKAGKPIDLKFPEIYNYD